MSPAQGNGPIQFLRSELFVEHLVAALPLLNFLSVGRVVDVRPADRHYLWEFSLPASDFELIVEHVFDFFSS